MARANLDLTDSFTVEEKQRLRRTCEVLRTTYEEFILWSVRHALDEMEGYAQEARNNHGFWNRSE